jgi:hypothetical protein
MTGSQVRILFAAPAFLQSEMGLERIGTDSGAIGDETSGRHADRVPGSVTCRLLVHGPESPAYGTGGRWFELTLLHHIDSI